jgi:phosphatidylglycerophosphatase A
MAVALGLAYQAAGWALAVPVGFACCWRRAGLLGGGRNYLRATGGEDPSEVVIDEVAGQWLALSFTVHPFWFHGVPNLGCWSPGRAGWRRSCSSACSTSGSPGWSAGWTGAAMPAGVMLDDLWAGLFAGSRSMAAGRGFITG